MIKYFRFFPKIRGGDALWSGPEQGTQLLLAETFNLAAAQTLAQSARFNNTNAFFGGTVTIAGAAQTLTQSARFNNTNTFYGGVVNLNLSQAARFNNAAQFFGGVVNLNLSQASRFDSANSFFGGTITFGGAAQTLTQSARFNNLNQFFGGTIPTDGPESWADITKERIVVYEKPSYRRKSLKQEVEELLERPLEEAAAEMVEAVTEPIDSSALVAALSPRRPAAPPRVEDEEDDELLLLL